MYILYKTRPYAEILCITFVSYRRDNTCDRLTCNEILYRILEGVTYCKRRILVYIYLRRN